MSDVKNCLVRNRKWSGNKQLWIIEVMFALRDFQVGVLMPLTNFDT